jgi:hypothetical protein
MSAAMWRIVAEAYKKYLVKLKGRIEKFNDECGDAGPGKDTAGAQFAALVNKMRETVVLMHGTPSDGDSEVNTAITTYTKIMGNPKVDADGKVFAIDVLDTAFETEIGGVASSSVYKPKSLDVLEDGEIKLGAYSVFKTTGVFVLKLDTEGNFVVRWGDPNPNVRVCWRWLWPQLADDETTAKDYWEDMNLQVKTLVESARDTMHVPTSEDLLPSAQYSAYINRRSFVKERAPFLVILHRTNFSDVAKQTIVPSSLSVRNFRSSIGAAKPNDVYCEYGRQPTNGDADDADDDDDDDDAGDSAEGVLVANALATYLNIVTMYITYRVDEYRLSNPRGGPLMAAQSDRERIRDFVLLGKRNRNQSVKLDLAQFYEGTIDDTSRRQQPIKWQVDTEQDLDTIAFIADDAGGAMVFEVVSTKNPPPSAPRSLVWRPVTKKAKERTAYMPFPICHKDQETFIDYGIVGKRATEPLVTNRTCLDMAPILEKAGCDKFYTHNESRASTDTLVTEGLIGFGNNSVSHWRKSLDGTTEGDDDSVEVESYFDEQDEEDSSADGSESSLRVTLFVTPRGHDDDDEEDEVTDDGDTEEEVEEKELTDVERSTEMCIFDVFRVHAWSMFRTFHTPASGPDDTATRRLLIVDVVRLWLYLRHNYVMQDEKNYELNSLSDAVPVAVYERKRKRYRSADTVDIKVTVLAHTYIMNGDWHTSGNFATDVLDPMSTFTQLLQSLSTDSKFVVTVTSD